MVADGMSCVGIQATPPQHEQPGTEVGPRARRHPRYLAWAGAAVRTFARACRGESPVDLATDVHPDVLLSR